MRREHCEQYHLLNLLRVNLKPGPALVVTAGECDLQNNMRSDTASTNVDYLGPVV